MKFYSGFSLKNDTHFFSDYINSSVYTVSGFSYGAIKAFNYAKEALKCGERVDTLQLFSPAFFQTKSEKFKKLQLIGFKRDKNSYLENFIGSCFSPHTQSTVEHTESSSLELEELLKHEWILSDLQELTNSGVNIEVYLGEKDSVIDVENAKEFFLEVSTLTYIKNANHFLQTN